MLSLMRAVMHIVHQVPGRRLHIGYLDPGRQDRIQGSGRNREMSEVYSPIWLRGPSDGHCTGNPE